jgi:hypothetical protein
MVALPLRSKARWMILPLYGALQMEEIDSTSSLKLDVLCQLHGLAPPV